MRPAFADTISPMSGPCTRTLQDVGLTESSTQRGSRPGMLLGGEWYRSGGSRVVTAWHPGRHTLYLFATTTVPYYATVTE